MLLENISLGLAVGFVALLVAAAFDIKTREVPDWLNFSLAFFAVGYALILSVYHGTTGFFINAVAGLLLGVGLGVLMFYTGQWGGGDSKLIIGICAIFGLAIPGLSKIHGDNEILIFFINTLFVGAVYGFTYSIWKAVANFDDFKKEAVDLLSTKRLNWARLGLSALLIAGVSAYIIAPGFESASLLALSIVSVILLYSWVLITCVEKIHMIQEVKVSTLTEGDWIVNPVTKGNKTILRPAKTGVTLEDIALLKKQNIRSVVIKVGLPFVPSFLIAYVITLVFGNWFLALV